MNPSQVEDRSDEEICHQEDTAWEERQEAIIDWKGLDSDNGSQFINDILYKYCHREKLEFTRSRPSRKNDNAYIEQKNGTHVS